MTPALIRDLRAENTVTRRLSAGVAATAIFAALAFAVLFECAEPIVTLLAGSNFTQAAQPLRVIAAAAGLAGLTSILRFGAIALNQQARMTRADLAGVGLAVVAHLILIPRFGLMGAAFGRLLGDVVTLAVAAWSLRAQLRPAVLGFVSIATLAGLCLIVGLEFTEQMRVPWFAALVLCGPVVLGCVLLLPRVRSQLTLLIA